MGEVALAFFCLLLLLWLKVRGFKKKGNMTMIDGLKDDSWIGVKYFDVIIPMRYLEYKVLWMNMSRKEKREMAMKIRKKLEKGKIKKASSAFDTIIDE